MHDGCGSDMVQLLEWLRETVSDSTRNIFKNLYQDSLDGPIVGHVLVQISRFLEKFLVEIGQVFTEPL